MKTNKISQIILLPILILYMVICSSCVNRKKENSFTKIIPVPIQNMNHEITLSLPIIDNNAIVPKLGKSITFQIDNHSKDLIKFPSNYGIKIFRYDAIGENWIEIENITKYIPEGNRQVSPKGVDSLGYIITGAFPDLPLNSNPVDIRIVVIGTIYQNDIATNKIIGAYLDVTVQP
jgi:hypothetical protein